MHTTQPDAFALKNSGLDDFLYADVGAELNGSPLTILSVLARLGKDPWAQAAGWAALPTAAAIDGLSQSIAQMPLAPAALAGSRDIAARLVQLLPRKPRPSNRATTRAKPAAASETKATAAQNGSFVMMIWCGVAVWVVLSMLLMSKPATNLAAQTAATAGVTVASPAPTPRHTTTRATASPAQPLRTPVSD